MSIFKKPTIFILTLLPIVIFSSCASLFGENSRTVRVNSDPTGAGIYIEGKNRGSTPKSIELPRYIYGEQEIEIRKPGYETETLVVHSDFQLVSLWNLLNGWGFIIDAATGDIVKIAPNDRSFNAELRSKK